MISEQKSLQLLYNLPSLFPSPTILSLQDFSKGVDQQVKIANFVINDCEKIRKKRNNYIQKNKKKKQTYSEQSKQIKKIIIKYPKQQPQKIMHQVIGCQRGKLMGVPVPQILYTNSQYLIESYIKGNSLNKIQTSVKNFKQIYKQLGTYLRLLHNNKGIGFGKLKSNKLIGEYKDKSFLKKNIQQQLKILKNQNFYPTNYITQIQKYLHNNSFIIRKVQKQTCLLHGDYSEDNIIADNKKINAVVDFGDLVMGSPMQDFGRLYLQNFGTYKWDALMEGYGSHRMNQIQFYTVYLSLWLTNSCLNKKIHRGRIRYLQKAIKRIIQYKAQNI